MDLITTLLTYLSPIITAIVGWIFGRRQKVAETESFELANVQRALDIYREMLDDTKKRIDELGSKIEQLTNENDKLRMRLSAAKQDNDNLRARIAHLEAKLK